MVFGNPLSASFTISNRALYLPQMRRKGALMGPLRYVARDVRVYCSRRQAMAGSLAEVVESPAVEDCT